MPDEPNNTRKINYDPISEGINSFNNAMGDFCRRHKILERVINPTLALMVLASVVLPTASIIKEKGFKEGIRESYSSFCKGASMGMSTGAYIYYNR